MYSPSSSVSSLILSLNPAVGVSPPLHLPAVIVIPLHPGPWYHTICLIDFFEVCCIKIYLHKQNFIRTTTFSASTPFLNFVFNWFEDKHLCLILNYVACVYSYCPIITQDIPTWCCMQYVATALGVQLYWWWNVWCRLEEWFGIWPGYRR